MILTPAQRKAAEKSLAIATGEEQRIQFLEKLAAVSPAMAQRVADMRTKKEWICEFCKTALAADDAS